MKRIVLTGSNNAGTVFCSDFSVMNIFDIRKFRAFDFYLKIHFLATSTETINLLMLDNVFCNTQLVFSVRMTERNQLGKHR